ncbi:MAG: hypothetical protein ABSG38_16390 [Spirochaetia bacterium]
MLAYLDTDILPAVIVKKLHAGFKRQAHKPRTLRWAAALAFAAVVAGLLIAELLGLVLFVRIVNRLFLLKRRAISDEGGQVNAFFLRIGDVPAFRLALDLQDARVRQKALDFQRSLKSGLVRIRIWPDQDFT